MRKNASQILIFTLLAVAAVMEFVLIRKQTLGDFLNSYPFISPDGFDWIYEGAYAKYVLNEGFNSLPPPLIWRHPMFVFISFLDSVFSHRGIIFALTFSGAFFAAGVFLVLILRELGVRWSVSLWATLVFILTPFAYFRTWVLADALAIALLHANIICLIRYGKDKRLKLLVMAVLMMLLGGWTQTYAIIPFIVGLSLILLRDLFERKNVLIPMLISAGGLAIYFISLIAWYRIIPHEMVPTQFGLLKISVNMARFYVNTWVFYFGPLLCVVAYYMFFFRMKELFSRFDTAALIAIVGAFAGLLFFYQWPEARFTYFYFGLVVVLAAAMLDFGSPASTSQKVARQAAAVVSLTAVVLTSLVAVPPSYWQPSIAAVQIDPKNSWFWQFFTARPLDRFGLVQNCQTSKHFCDAAPVLGNMDPYRDRIMRDYRTLMLLEKK